MNIRISENIRAFRKERKQTQEQLAEALGVTVGAVSKWESGTTVPDISLIVDMAEFFETSVDTLLGYALKSGSQNQAYERIRGLRNEKRFSEATVETERALIKYPNSFKIIYAAAVMYSMKGVEERSSKSYTRALELYERALTLINQNDDPEISEQTIKSNIANTYLGLGDIDKALDYMKKTNAGRLNNETIGFVLANIDGKADEAKKYLTNALIDNLLHHCRIMNSFANVYEKKKDYSSSLCALNEQLAFINGLMKPDARSYLIMLKIQTLTGIAIFQAFLNNTKDMKETLTEAWRLCRIFDENPVFHFSGMRFIDDDTDMTAFDDFGATAEQGVDRILANQDNVSDLLTGTWKEIKESI